MVGKILAQRQIWRKTRQGRDGRGVESADTHLDRFVALKTVPAERLADAERKRRLLVYTRLTGSARRTLPPCNTAA
jgi:hypothetical protein